MSREYTTNDVWRLFRDEILALVHAAADGAGVSHGAFGSGRRFYGNVVTRADGSGFDFDWIGPQESNGTIRIGADLRSARRAA
jgi:hypothetical protein